MQPSVQPFENREDAGRQLAQAIGTCESGKCIVLAIPRGGVVVGYQIAVYLNLCLDVMVPRKIPAPGQPELAIGAVASWGDHEIIVDEQNVNILGISREYIEQESKRQLEEVTRRLVVYRGTTEPPDVIGREVILVDDGIATGYTTRAAVMATRRIGAKSITLAVPVGPRDSIEKIRPYVDKLICLRIPTPFLAVGYWYRDFSQTTDDEVLGLLERAKTIEAG